MYEWKCSPYDSDNNKYYLPHFGEISEIFQLTWQDSLVDVSYVYPINEIELNCTGLVTALEFCYTTTLSPNNRSPRNHFQFLTLKKLMNTEFEVTRSIPVTSNPTSASCMGGHTPRRCCAIKEFSPQDQFNITSPNFAIGFGPRKDNKINQQGLFADMYPTYTTSSHTYNMPLNLDSNYIFSNPGETTLRLAWLHIGKSK